MEEEEKQAFAHFDQKHAIENPKMIEQATTDVQRLIQELRAYQVDLEMRNEELRKSQEELQLLQAKYFDLFEHAPVGYCNLDTNGVITETNLTAADLLGMSRQYLRGKPFSRFIASQYQALFLEYLQRLVDTRLKQTFQLPIRCNTGRNVEALLEALVVEDTSDRESIRITLTDITDRAEREKELKQSNARFRFLYEHTPAFNIIVNPSGIIKGLNQRTLDELGYDRDDVIGRAGGEFAAAQDREKLRRALKAALSGQEVSTVEVTVPAKDGTPHIVLFAVGHAVLQEEDPRGGVIFTGMDVTEHRRAEKQLRDEQKQALERLQQLVEVSQDVLTQSTLEGLLQTIIDRGREMTGARIGTAEYDFQSRRFLVSATSNHEGSLPPSERDALLILEKGLFLQLTEKGGTLRMNEEGLRSQQFWKGLSQDHILPRNLLASPLRDKNGRPIGIIMVCDKAGEGFTEEDEALIVQLSSLASLGLQHLEAWVEVEKKAEQMEARVKERTANLLQANKWLATEIAHRVKTENELQQQKEILQTIFDHIPVLICFYDAAGNLDLVNRAFGRTIGWTLEEAKNMDIIEACCPDPEYRQKVLDHLLEKPSEWQDFTLKTRHGKELLTSWANVPLSDGTRIAIGIDITERKHAEKALKDSENALKDLSIRLLNAQEDERKLIAMDLHDSIAAGLAAIKMRLERIILHGALEASPVTELLAGTISMVKDTNEKVRDIMRNLRPSMLDDLGVLPTLRTHCKEIEKIYPEIKVTFTEHVEEEDIPPSLKIVIFRVVQEALNNVAKHSQANQAHISLSKRNRGLELVVSDNGKGFNIGLAGKAQGFGISSMTERTRLSDGSLHISHSKDGGIEIRALWPLLD